MKRDLGWTKEERVVMGKRGILIVSIGTSQIEALKNTTVRLQEEASKRFGGGQCYLAFSSRHILKKMNEKSSEAYLSISEALAQMAADGIEEAVVQPTYLLNGLENDRMLELMEQYKGQFEQMRIGKPLLSAKEDYIKTLQVILAEADLQEEEALVLVGHGTNHLSNSAYQNLEYTAYVQGQRNVFVGTMEGGKSQEMTLWKLRVSGYKKVRLMPLLFVAGYHAKKDIAAESGSWKSILEDAGYEVKPALTGLGEMESIREIFLEHLEAAMLRG